MHDSSDNYTSILLEEIRDQNRAVIEEVQAIRHELAEVPKRDEFEHLKADVRTIKAAVTDLSGELTDHERRIRHLEAGA